MTAEGFVELHRRLGRSAGGRGSPGGGSKGADESAHVRGPTAERSGRLARATFDRRRRLRRGLQLISKTSVLTARPIPPCRVTASCIRSVQ